MNEVWLIAALWALVGVAAILIATWVGRGFRDEVFKTGQKPALPQKPLLLIRGGRTGAIAQPALREFHSGLIMLRGVPGARPEPPDRVRLQSM